MKAKGFTLVELLIYLAIFGVISGLFIGILGIAARVKEREVGTNEVATQLNFVTQTIQRLIRESSAAMVNCLTPTSTPVPGTLYDNDKVDVLGECGALPAGTSLVATTQPVLRLRMKETANDPTIIWTENGKVRMQQGTQPAADLTTNRVTVPANGLEFKKFSKADNNVWHDVIEIQLTLNYNSPNPAAQFSQKLPSAVGRASAATFDDRLLPGTDTLDIGGNAVNQQWQDLYLNRYLYEPGNYDGAGRGYKTIGYLDFQPSLQSPSCSVICANHGLTCDPVAGTLQIFPSVSYPGCTSDPTNSSGICYCQ